MTIPRRTFLKFTAASVVAGSSILRPRAQASEKSFSPKLGLVTYNWGKDWDVPTVIKNCETTGFGGVELRSTHKHGVEITLGKEERQAVRRQFEDSKVELVGLGSACEYHSEDPAVVDRNIEDTKAFVRLCKDVGGTGVKVRPNGLPKDVPVEKTIEQIGKSLRAVATYGADYGVQIRVEVHGRGTAELPLIKQMMDIADHPNAVICWNCNPTDLNGEGLEHNFELVKKHFGATIHIHDLRNDMYPWKPFFGLLRSIQYDDWTLIEEGKVPDDIVAAMHENRKTFDLLVAETAKAK
ncbi:MAG: sugar phosphate isomerase/epimerase [Planctomycetota bacterium]|nr:sugar phosphate isomerase/epimerase [Planctomycetota bacterium]MDA1251719.1 sugar phosphate isomerase/epimerase [Planctomycetota bacterium]